MPKGAYALALALALVLVTEADAGPPKGKQFRIGWLGSGTEADARRGVEHFQQGLRDQGYTPGTNVHIEYRHADGNFERLSGLAEELVRTPVDVLVTAGEPAAMAARRATSTIPVVLTEYGSDPVRAGLVVSLRRPGGNVTGQATMSDNLWPKRINVFKEFFVPRLARALVLLNPANPGNLVCQSELRAAGWELAIEFEAVEAKDRANLAQILGAQAGKPADALFVCWDTVTLADAKAIADYALRRGLPTLTPLREYVEAGALMSMGIDLAAHRRRAAWYVDRILNGARPADLPVEQAGNPVTVVNLSTAKSLRIALPSVVQQGLVNEIVP